VRLGLAVLAFVLLLLPLAVRTSWPWWALVALVPVFIVLGVVHSRTERRQNRHRALREFHEGELARLEERWRLLPDDGADLSPRDARSAGRAGDLDLFGRASLFQRLSRAQTREGRRTLARWLLHGAELPEIAARQAAVLELAQKPLEREGLFAAARAGATAPLLDEVLIAFGERGAPLPFARVLFVLAHVFPPLLGGAIAMYFFDLGASALVIVALAQTILVLACHGPVQSRANQLASPDRALERYAAIFDRVAATRYDSPRLQAIQARLTAEGASASDRLRALRVLVERLETSRNPFFALSIGPALLWDLHIVLRAERWRRSTGRHLRGWLEAVGELEALASLGGLLAEGRASLPTLVESEGRFSAVKLAHPLIDRSKAVGNDLTLGGPGSVLLLSGSNMSGKSTLLRSVGLAVVLAEAGGPVLAERLELSRFSLWTSVRVADSLAEGASHFYAELVRIKEVVDAARQEPRRILYLLDEMLHGTNSKERYVGAVSVIRWLSSQASVGIVTTHDLALAAVSGELPAGTVTQRHFGDEVVGDQIRFDYHLREGPIQSTNALRLMRAVGIDIELSAPDPG